MSVKVFISYAHADQELHKKLVEHLSPLTRLGKISIWQDQEILPGENWDESIQTCLKDADLIVLLVSASFIASKYCWDEEVLKALQRHQVGTAKVIPVILRPVVWQNSPLGQLQVLPTEGKPVVQWNDQDAAFEDVVRGIQKVVEALPLRKAPDQKLVRSSPSQRPRPFPPVGTFLGYLHTYQELFWTKYRWLDLKGLETRGPFDLELASVFVEPYIDLPRQTNRAGADLLPPQLARASEEHKTSWSFLQADQWRPFTLVLVGAPGSGKTTILQHLGLSLVPAWRQEKRENQQLPRLPYRLPVLLFLRKYAATIVRNGQFSLADAVQVDLFPQRQDHRRRDWIERELDRGQCLILLDGLDEVDIRQRQAVAEWVNHQILAYPLNRFIVTSRPHGYRANPLEHALLLEIRPFTQEQIHQFLHAWYRQDRSRRRGKDDSGTRKEARQVADDLLARLRHKPGLHALTVNPLLLTMLVTVHSYRGMLPGSRAKLYQEICQAFLGERRQEHHIAQDWSADQCQVVLQALAYKMMEQEIQAIRQFTAQRWIHEPLQRVNKEPDQLNPALAPAHFLQEVEQNSGLLLRRESGVYTLAHLTFQEYLAMRYIRDEHLEKVLIKHVTETWWREVILLYCASGDASALIEACLHQGETSTAALELAIDCDEEALQVKPEVRRRLHKLLREGVESPDAHRRRMIAGVLLTRRSHQMVPLDGETYRDTSLVTCGEYQVFLDEQPARHKPAHWETPHFLPGQGNTPVLGVRQEQAKAFVTWLTEREPGPWQYRLPKAGEREEQKIADLLPAGIGFWLEEEQRFCWAKQAPDLPIESLKEVLAGVFPTDLDKRLNEVQGIINGAARARDKLKKSQTDAAGPPDETFRWANELDKHIERGKIFINELKKALPSGKEPDPPRARARALALALAFCPEDKPQEDSTRTAHLLIERHVSKGIQARALSFDLGPRLEQGLTERLEQKEKARFMEKMLDLYLNLAILEGRVRGHLLPCEGILLVKEQK